MPDGFKPILLGFFRQETGVFPSSGVDNQGFPVKILKPKLIPVSISAIVSVFRKGFDWFPNSSDQKPGDGPFGFDFS